MGQDFGNIRAGIWILASDQAKVEGCDDKPEDAFKYVRALSADYVPDASIKSYFENAAHMLRWTDEHTKITYCAFPYPDYHAENLDSGPTGYCTHMPLPLDGKKLDRDAETLRFASPVASLFGYLNWHFEEIYILLFRQKGWFAAPHARNELSDWRRLGHGAFGRSLTVLKICKAWEELLEGAFGPVCARPAHLVVAHRRLVQIGRIPIKWHAAAEEPLAVLAFIAVEIHHLHNDPFVRSVGDRCFMLVLGVNNSVRMGCIVHLNNVTADVMRCASKGTAQSAVHITA